MQKCNFARFLNKAENVTNDTAALHSHRDHSGSSRLLACFVSVREGGSERLLSAQSVSAKIPQDQFRPWEFPSFLPAQEAAAAAALTF